VSRVQVRKKGAPKIKTEPLPGAAGLRRRAEASLRQRRETRPSVLAGRTSTTDSQRLLHELQVHQIELEMQNEELRGARGELEVALEKYADLYEFAPVGYFSLGERGLILEANLTGSTLLGVERSRLIGRSLPQFVDPQSRPGFLEFLKRVFAEAGKQACEAGLRKEDGTAFWASLYGSSASCPGDPRKSCRVAVSDITSLKQVQDAQRRTEVLALSNRELKREIIRRQAVEEALTDSEKHKNELLEQLKHLSHSMLRSQEEERKRISRELHDEITQTLVGITVHLDALALAATVSPARLKRKIVQTRRLVEKSVGIVHQFARDLRPTSLDDLGLTITLHSFLNDFMKQTGIRVRFTTFTEADQLNGDQRTVLFRIVQSALANVARHAFADRADVNIFRTADTVHLEISDNGKSFDVERMLNAKRNKHLGLLGMRERVEMIGGTFTIHSEPDKGTKIHAQFPFTLR
jgi:PAS domain S-box-containing protein